ncbi:gluconate 2-dehydrogenase subunit 3 family protein [Cupriavidus sp. DB3]|uniref:twin-arginine translocation signal domain-containing protein n=1 Tax=Cupriavidus sp. DB3 TaxID=2873259 RepID=UPI001CF1737A|nr:twin-arginine translocation signal domain-containing protein [Cupriavidus sp. DB3]MCA7083599.1 gluconate 2-dehydrogenase subunit 3 family protein [Cupriavidus sp. DB3]
MQDDIQHEDAAAPAAGMRIVAKTQPVTRRGFLRGTGLAAIGVAVVSPGALAKPAREALVTDLKALGTPTARTLLVMARDIFPHDRFADRYYVQAIAPLDQAAAKDKAVRTLLQRGARELDAAAQRKHGKPYAQLQDEADRVALLKAIETTPFFEKVRGEMVTSLYDNKAVWPLLGYEGSSWEKGGYANRGFNDIDWI